MKCRFPDMLSNTKYTKGPAYNRCLTILPLLMTTGLLLLSLSSAGQSYKTMNVTFNRIREVPWFDIPAKSNKNNKQNNNSKRGPYNKFIRFDTSAVLYLVDKLTDTNPSKVLNSCTQINLMNCELALYLLKTIDKFDERVVTNTLWDDYDTCGLASVSFRMYFSNNRATFQNQYRIYLTSEERQRVLKERKKIQPPTAMKES